MHYCTWPKNQHLEGEILKKYHSIQGVLQYGSVDDGGTSISHLVCILCILQLLKSEFSIYHTRGLLSHSPCQDSRGPPAQDGSQITKQYLNKSIQSTRKWLAYTLEKFLRQPTVHHDRLSLQKKFFELWFLLHTDTLYLFEQWSPQGAWLIPWEEDLLNLPDFVKCTLTLVITLH